MLRRAQGPCPAEDPGDPSGLFPAARRPGRAALAGSAARGSGRESAGARQPCASRRRPARSHPHRPWRVRPDRRLLAHRRRRPVPGGPTPLRRSLRSPGRAGLSGDAGRRGRGGAGRGPLRILGSPVRGGSPPGTSVRLGTCGVRGPGERPTRSSGRVGPRSPSGRTAAGGGCVGAGAGAGRGRRSGRRVVDLDVLPSTAGRRARCGRLTGGGRAPAEAAALRGDADTGVTRALQLRGAPLRRSRSRDDDRPASSPAGDGNAGGRHRRTVGHGQVQDAGRGRTHQPGRHRPGVLGRSGRALGSGTGPARRDRGGRLHDGERLARSAPDRPGHRVARSGAGR